MRQQLGPPALFALVVLLAPVVPAQLQAGVQRDRRPAIRRPQLVAQPETVSFGAVSAGSQSQLSFQLQNTGGATATIDGLSLLVGASGTGETFTVDFMAGQYAGGLGDVQYSISESLGAQGTTQVDVTFAPTEERLDSVILRIEGNFPDADVQLQGLGGHQGDPFLHVVIEGPDFLVDYDADGMESFTLDGTPSHTHEPGQAIVGWTWERDAMVVGTGPVLVADVPLGSEDFTLTIADDNDPAHTLDDTRTVDVVPASAVPGVLARYYDGSGSSASALLDAVPATADFGEVRGDFAVPGPAAVGGSPFTQDVMVRLEATVQVATSGTYELTASGGVDRRLELDGSPVTGPLVLSAGSYALEARFAVDALGDLPLDLTFTLDGGPAETFDPATLAHDESALVPVVNSMPATGLDTGGNPITITGMGFFPASSVVVHWGGQDLDLDDFTSVEASRIDFVSPPGTGQIAVTVETPQGTSNGKSFLYQIGGPVPVQFANVRTMTVPIPTSAAWGPDGKLYVTALDGRISVVGFDENWAPTSLVTYPGVSGLPNNDTLGIAFDPYDPPSPVRAYVAHGQHWVNGGTTPTGPSPYTGQVSVLEGPSFDTPIPVATGLPTSNHDHAMNGLVFDDNGDLFVSVGSNTNAGVKHPNHGDLPESPLSSAVLELRLSDPAFDGAVEYVETGSGAPNDDQRYGDVVDVVPGSGVEVQASGLRNAYGLVYTTQQRLYATDNGSNIGFGPSSTGPTTEVPEVYSQDELLLVERGNYYGQANRNRGRTDPRQNVWRGPGEPTIPGVFAQAITTLVPSADGIDEYRSDTFQGQMRGDLVVQKWGGNVRRIELSPDGRSLVQKTVLDPWVGGLSLVTGPGGAIVSLDYSSSKLRVMDPDDLSAVGLVVHDVTPWRAPATGGAKFVLGGVGFGSLANTTVTIDGIPATLTSVTSKRIAGVVPVNPSPTTDLVDVVVTVGGSSDTLEDAFRFLMGRGQQPGRWESLDPMPTAIFEATTAVVDGVLYVFGNGTWLTQAYDLVNRVWLPDEPARPFVGDHHSAEVVGGEIYLVGGLSGGSEGKVQIYDPDTDSWSTGTDLPWAGASVSTAAIDGKIYAAGGILTGFTVNNCAVYDPVADSWTPRAAMPAKRNHTAAGTDGSRMFVFGGRTGGNFVSNGFDDVQIYDPATNTWEWSGDPGSTLEPLPIGRGGMGKAVYWDGEFYVMGGETLDGPGAIPGLNVYDRVDVYDPVANTWRLEAPMPNPRHATSPALYQGWLYVAGGAVQSGTSFSDIFDAFTRQ